MRKTMTGCKRTIGMAVAAFMALATMVSIAQAGPLNVNSPYLRALETFDYSPGDLPGNNGGIGWDGAWYDTGDPSHFVESPDFSTWPGIFGAENLPLALVETDGLVIRMGSSFESRRAIAGDPIGTAGQTVWFSTLALRATGESLTYLRLLDGDNNAQLSISMAAAHGENLWLNTANGSTSGSGNVGGKERGVWVISRIDYMGEGNGDVYLWVMDQNDFTGMEDLATWTPDISSVTASLNVTDGSLGQFERIEVSRNDGGQRIDRLHLHVVPEPGSLALLGIGGLMLLTRQRFRRH